MVEQPLPRVTRADVERIIRREFLPAQYDTVLALLAEYGREAHRVHLALLKLSAGDVDALQSNLEAAKRDYRDVLAWAEYPAYIKDVNTRRLPPDEQKKVIYKDRAQ